MLLRMGFVFDEDVEKQKILMFGEVSFFIVFLSSNKYINLFINYVDKKGKFFIII